MPQMNRGGKFIFGKSLIRDDLTIPPQHRRLQSTAPHQREKSIFLLEAKSPAAFV